MDHIADFGMSGRLVCTACHGRIVAARESSAVKAQKVDVYVADLISAQ